VLDDAIRTTSTARSCTLQGVAVLPGPSTRRESRAAVCPVAAQRYQWDFGRSARRRGAACDQGEGSTLNAADLPISSTHSRATSRPAWARPGAELTWCCDGLRHGQRQAGGALARAERLYTSYDHGAATVARASSSALDTDPRVTRANFPMISVASPPSLSPR